MSLPRLARVPAAAAFLLSVLAAVPAQSEAPVHLRVYVGKGERQPLHGQDVLVEDIDSRSITDLGMPDMDGQMNPFLPKAVMRKGKARFLIKGYFVFNPCNGMEGSTYLPVHTDDPVDLHVEPDGKWFQEDAGCAEKQEFEQLARNGWNDPYRGAIENPRASLIPAAWTLAGPAARTLAYGIGQAADAHATLDEIASRLHCDVATVRAGIEQFEQESKSPYDLGVSSMLEGKYQAAAGYFQQAIKADEDDDDLVDDDVGLMRAYWKLNNPAQAERFAWDALDIYPFDPGLLGSLSRIMRAQEQNQPAAAVEALRNAILRNQDERDGEEVGKASRMLGMVLERSGDSEHAQGLLESAIRWDIHSFGDRDPYVAMDSIDLGVYFLGKGDYARAGRDYSRAAEILSCAPDAETLKEQPLTCSIVLNNVGDLYNHEQHYLDGARYASYALRLLQEHGRAVAASPLLTGETNTLRQACGPLNGMNLVDRQRQDRDRYCAALGDGR